jgi:hypothetical protein
MYIEIELWYGHKFQKKRRLNSVILFITLVKIHMARISYLTVIFFLVLTVIYSTSPSCQAGDVRKVVNRPYFQFEFLCLACSNEFVWRTRHVWFALCVGCTCRHQLPSPTAAAEVYMPPLPTTMYTAKVRQVLRTYALWEWRRLLQTTWTHIGVLLHAKLKWSGVMRGRSRLPHHCGTDMNFISSYSIYRGWK